MLWWHGCISEAIFNRIVLLSTKVHIFWNCKTNKDGFTHTYTYLDYWELDVYRLHWNYYISGGMNIVTMMLGKWRTIHSHTYKKWVLKQSYEYAYGCLMLTIKSLTDICADNAMVVLCKQASFYFSWLTFVCCSLHWHRQLHEIIHSLCVPDFPGLATLCAFFHQESEDITWVFWADVVPLKRTSDAITWAINHNSF